MRLRRKPRKQLYRCLPPSPAYAARLRRFQLTRRTSDDDPERTRNACNFRRRNRRNGGRIGWFAVWPDRNCDRSIRGRDDWRRRSAIESVSRSDNVFAAAPSPTRLIYQLQPAFAAGQASAERTASSAGLFYRNAMRLKDFGHRRRLPAGLVKRRRRDELFGDFGAQGDFAFAHRKNTGRGRSPSRSRSAPRLWPAGVTEAKSRSRRRQAA